MTVGGTGMPLDGRGLRPFVAMAWLGVATTAANTFIPIIVSSDIDASAARTLSALREPILFVHAIATLLPMLALALLTMRVAPFAALTAAAFTGIEKLLELVGQSLRLFPPEESMAGVPVREIVAAVWDQLYFTLWFCNTLAAAAAGWLMLRSLGGRRGWAAATSAWLGGLLTLLMLLGPGYVGWVVSPVPGWLFFVVFVAYRLGIAGTLQRLSHSPAARGEVVA